VSSKALGGVVLIFFLPLAVGCADKTKTEDCQKLDDAKVFYASPRSYCWTDGGLAEIEAHSAKVTSLQLRSPDGKAIQSRLKEYDDKELTLCRQPPPDDRDAAALDAVAIARRGYIEGASFNCNQLLHPPHL